ncbi:protein of unknown function [Rhodovastum atsumiense]|nr:protein of unknown function [Rhodovastum atsumiense]
MIFGIGFISFWWHGGRAASAARLGPNVVAGSTAIRFCFETNPGGQHEAGSLKGGRATVPSPSFRLLVCRRVNTILWCAIQALCPHIRGSLSSAGWAETLILFEGPSKHIHAVQSLLQWNGHKRGRRKMKRQEIFAINLPTTTKMYLWRHGSVPFLGWS